MWKFTSSKQCFCNTFTSVNSTFLSITVSLALSAVAVVSENSEIKDYCYSIYLFIGNIEGLQSATVYLVLINASDRV